MEYEAIKAMMEAAENPTTKLIYANHLKRLEGKQPQCSACPEPLNPINQTDEE